MTAPFESANDAQAPVAEPGRSRRAALGLIRRDRRAVAVMITLNVLATAAGLAGPWLLGRIIDTVTSGGSTSTIDRLALLILGFALLQLVLTRYAHYVGARFGERASARIRETFLDRVLRLPASVVERIARGDLATRGSGDTTTVAATMRDAMPEVLIATLQSLFVLVAVFIINPLLGLCGLTGLLGVCLVTRWYLKRARTAYLAVGAANSALTETLAATSSGARTVEALGLQQRRIRASLDAIEYGRQTRMRALALRTVLFPVIDVSYILPLVSVLLVGGALYFDDAISLGAVVASALYFRQLSGPLDVLTLWIDQLQSAAASFARLEGVGALPQSGPPSAPPPVDDRIDVTDVHYAYSGGPDVLHGVSLDVRPGERLAIVGPSGAGKSTLGRLLAGIDRPRRGSITVGGVPVADVPPEQLRRQILLVTQENHVFHDSLRGNLLVARPSASDDDVWAALVVVGATWAADLPSGLDTQLSDDAHRLDGAQAQQLALARVVLADPHTVILDEATAMLDPRTARKTERALSAVLRGRTVLAIAHRLHTAHDADRIAVLQDGRLTEIGTHHHLVSGDGGYAELWRSWHGAGDTAGPAIR